RGLSESKAVLDDADAVLAMGARWCRDEDGRPAVDGFVSARARGVDGAVDQYDFEPRAPESHAGGAVVATHRDCGEVSHGFHGLELLMRVFAIGLLLVATL